MSVQDYRQLLEYTLSKDGHYDQFKFIYDVISGKTLSRSLPLDVFLDMVCTNSDVVMSTLKIFILFPEIFEVSMEAIRLMWDSCDMRIPLPTRDELERIHPRYPSEIRKVLRDPKKEMKLVPVHNPPVTLESIMNRLNEVSRQNQELYQQNCDLKESVLQLHHEVLQMQKDPSWSGVYIRKY